jgi:hypothetical protein
MPSRDRWLLLTLLVAISTGGCDSAEPTSTPQTVATGTPSSTPTASASPAPTVAPTPLPTINCSTTGANDASLDLLTPVGFETIDLQTGALESPTMVDASDVSIVSTVVGGIELTADLAVGDGLEATTVISAVSADFVPFGTTSTLPVTATFSDSTASLRLPDQRVDGQLRVAIAWSTECGSGSGAGSVALTVVPSSVTAGCPTTSGGLAAEVQAMATDHITIGTLNLPVVAVSWSGRWLLGSGASDAPQFAGWDDEHPVSIAPGALIVVKESIDDLALVSLLASTYRRTDVLAYLAGGSTDELVTLAFGRHNANAKGRAYIPAQLEPGSYVIEVTASWLTSCLSLDTYSVVSVDVH